MTDYTVTFTLSYAVSAENEDSAEDTARQMFKDADPQIDDFDIDVMED